MALSRNLICFLVLFSSNFSFSTNPPSAILADYNLKECDNGNGKAFFDLSVLETQILLENTNGVGNVFWYFDQFQDNIIDPPNLVVGSTSVYAFIIIDDNTPAFGPIPVCLTVDSLPIPVIAGIFGICSPDTSTFTLEENYAQVTWTLPNTDTGINYTVEGPEVELTAINSGNITVEVVDENGCAGSSTIPFLVSYLLEVDCIIDSLVSDSSAMDGLIIVDVESGGIPDYTVTVDGPDDFDFEISNLSNNEIPLPDLEAGIYNITVTDALNCMVICTQDTLDVCQFKIDSSAISTTDPSCFGDNTGSIDSISLIGGSTPFSYQWSTSSIDTFPSIDQLTTGTYTIAVKDQFNCRDTLEITIEEPEELKVDTCFVEDATNENIADGSITLLISGGTGAYQIFWDGDGVGDLLDSNPEYIIQNLPKGDYNIIIRDENDCSISVQKSVDGPACTAVLNFEVDTISCFGDADGSISLNANSDHAPFAYVWEHTNQNTSSLSSLSAGDYMVTVVDTVLCEASATISVIQPDTLILSCTNPTGPTTVGGMNGTVDLQISGGTSPYNIEGDLPASNLPAGWHEFVVTDTNGCTDTCSVFLADPDCSDLMLSIEQITDADCHGESSGSIIVNAEGGIEPYTYLWSTGDLTFLPTLGNLAVGEYSVTLTDERDCTTSINFEIDEPEELTAECSQSGSISMQGATDGKAMILINGGTPPYSINYTGPTTGDTPFSSANSVVIQDLAAGTYEIVVIDTNGCQFDCEVIINDCLINISLDPTNISCFDANDGSISLDISQGIEPYNITWNIGAVNDPLNLTDLISGDYSVTVTDEEGCMTMASTTITEPDELIVSNCMQQDPVTTVGGTNGMASINITGGTGAYNIIFTAMSSGISLTETTDQIGTYIIDDLSADDYSIVVIDANGCEASCEDIITIEGPNCNLVPTLSINNISCYGLSNGTANITVGGGTPSYNITWSTGENTNSISNLAVGNYAVSVEDAIGCTLDTFVTITQPDTLILDCEELSPVSMMGASDGIAQITIIGGTAPYDISYVGVQSNQMGTDSFMNIGAYPILNLPSDTFDITLIDANGCIDTCSVFIATPTCETFDFNEILVTNISCDGDSDGSIQFSYQGGLSPFDIMITDGSSFTENVMDTSATDYSLNNLSPGTYTINITDGQDCMIDTFLIITEPASITFNNCPPITTGVSEAGATDGTVSISITGQLPNYFQIINSLGDVIFGDSIYSLDTTITNLAAGNYTLIGTSSDMCNNDCDFTIETDVMTDSPGNNECGDAFILDFQLPFYCPIDTAILASYTDYSSTNATFSSPSPPLPAFCLEQGQFDNLQWDVWHELMIMDTADIIDSIQITISTTFNLPYAVIYESTCDALSAENAIICAFDENQDQEITITLLTPEVDQTYLLMLAGLNEQGEYAITTAAYYSQTAESLGFPIADAGEDQLIMSNSTILQAIPSTLDDNFTANWMSISQEVNLTNPNGTSTLIQGLGENMTFEFVYVLSSEGCPSYDMDTVLVTTTDLNTTFELPKHLGITPNNQDGANDTMVIPGLEQFPNHKLFIYNRWGAIVYTAAPYEQGSWRGTYMNTANELPGGVYIVLLIINEEESHYSDITIFR